jgi:hypothetical protein
MLAYLQAGKELPHDSRKLELAPKAKGVKAGKRQTWYFTNDGGFVR